MDEKKTKDEKNKQAFVDTELDSASGCLIGAASIVLGFVIAIAACFMHGGPAAGTVGLAGMALVFAGVGIPIVSKNFRKFKVKHALIILAACAAFCILSVLVGSIFPSGGSKSGSDWDSLSSHQQEVAREVHDYKEALDGMK